MNLSKKIKQVHNVDKISEINPFETIKSKLRHKNCGCAISSKLSVIKGNFLFYLIQVPTKRLLLILVK